MESNLSLYVISFVFDLRIPQEKAVMYEFHNSYPTQTKRLRFYEVWLYFESRKTIIMGYEREAYYVTYSESKNNYQDSINLMLLTNLINALEGIEQGRVMMASDANKDILKSAGLYTDEVDAAGANDMAVVVESEDEGVIQAQPIIKTAFQGFLQERSTTDVSRAYYQALVKGYVNSRWIQLLQAAREEDRHSTEELIQAIKTYGATSGRDILLGVQSYLHLLRDTVN